jgi:hypothetical protein
MEWIVRIGKKDDTEGYNYVASPIWLVNDIALAASFDDYMEAHEAARKYTWGEVIPKTLLPIGARVVCFKGCGDEPHKPELDTHHGVISGSTTILRNGGSCYGTPREALAYIVGLDEPIDDAYGGVIYYIVVHPNNLREE